MGYDRVWRGGGAQRRSGQARARAGVGYYGEGGGGAGPESMYTKPCRILLGDRLPRGTALQSLMGFDVWLQASTTVV